MSGGRVAVFPQNHGKRGAPSLVGARLRAAMQSASNLKTWQRLLSLAELCRIESIPRDFDVIRLMIAGP